MTLGSGAGVREKNRSIRFSFGKAARLAARYSFSRPLVRLAFGLASGGAVMAAMGLSAPDGVASFVGNGLQGVAILMNKKYYLDTVMPLAASIGAASFFAIWDNYDYRRAHRMPLQLGKSVIRIGFAAPGVVAGALAGATYANLWPVTSGIFNTEKILRTTRIPYGKEHVTADALVHGLAQGWSMSMDVMREVLLFGWDSVATGKSAYFFNSPKVAAGMVTLSLAVAGGTKMFLLADKIINIPRDTIELMKAGAAAKRPKQEHGLPRFLK
jgi:hypothetical protein